MYRRCTPGPEVFLVHPGGPFFVNKDLGNWTIPKGVIEPGENELDAARREFREETGLESAGPYLRLGQIRQRSGKQVVCWAFEAADNLAPHPSVQSITFNLEWPPNSGTIREFPEVDRGAFFSIPDAHAKLIPAQVPFLDRLVAALGTSTTTTDSSGS